MHQYQTAGKTNGADIEQKADVYSRGDEASFLAANHLLKLHHDMTA